MVKAIDEYNKNKDERWIDQAIENYPLFMGLASEDFLIPPVEVDIVWHTHQLAGTHYRLVFIVLNLHY